MLDRMQKDLTLRLELVNSRLTAIKLEEEALSAEQQNLVDLLNLYKKRSYDPIDAERKHTEALLNTGYTQKERVHLGSTASIELKYTESFAMAYELNNNTPMTCSELAKAVGDIMGKTFPVPTLYRVVQRMAEVGKLAKSKRGRFDVYTWADGKEQTNER